MLQYPQRTKLTKEKNPSQGVEPNSNIVETDIKGTHKQVKLFKVLYPCGFKFNYFPSAL